jgi:iron complex outermembrane receptor protein
MVRSIRTLLLLSAGFGGALALGPAEATAGRPGTVAVADSGSVRGHVVEVGTGSPLAGTHVRLVELGRDELTHEDGEFHFDGLTAGQYTLVIERLGYRRVTRQIALAPGETAYLRIELQFSAIQLPGLMVTGGIGQRLGEESLRAATVVAGQELSRKLDATIAGTLQNEPGVAAVSTGPATARPVIRGLGGDRILILEDGERVGDLSSSSPDHAVAIEAVTAKQMEVVRGPAALLYGSNALGGVVNVIREEIPTSQADRVHGSVSVQGQTANRGFTGGGFLTHSFGPLALRVEGSARTAGDLRTPVGTLENTGLDTYNLSAGASWVDGWGHAGAAYRFYDSEYGLPGHEGGHEEGVTIEMRRHTVRGEALVRPSAGPFSSIEFDGTYSHYHQREIEESGILGTEFGLLTAVGSVLMRHGALGPFSEGAVGFQAQWRDYAAGGSLEAPPSNEYTVAGYFLEEIDLSPLRLQLGGRYDWHRVVPRDTTTELDIGRVRTRSFGSVSASVGALYEVVDGIAVGASVARAYRTPDVTELFSQGPHLATHSVEVGNPDLEEEIGLGFDLFVRATRERFRGEVAAFRNTIDGFIYPRNTGDRSPSGLPIYRHVGEDAVLTGFEGKAEWSVADRLVLDGTVSYVRGTLTRTDEPLPFIPPLGGRFGFRYEAPRYFVGAGMKWAARQDRVGEFEEPTDGYHVYDAVAGYRWTAFGRVHTLTLRADNVTDAEYRDHLSRVKAVMPQAGRNLSLLYRVNF